MVGGRLSGDLHGQFGICGFGLWLGAGKYLEFREGAEHELDDVAGAALVIVVGAGADTAEKANPAALLNHRLDAVDERWGKDGDAMPDSMVRDGV